jgi:hypothetical protein
VRIVIHESRRFRASDVFTARSPAVTSLERAVVDAAVWTADLTTACRIIVAPVQQRRTTAARIAAELARAGQVRHRRQLAALLADMAGGAEALSEIEFLRFCRRHRLPRPTCQVRLDAGGRRRFLDAIFELADGTIVRVEIDGGVHLSLTARWRDTAKDNDALLDGVAVLRFPSVAIYTDDPLAVRQLRRALATCQAHRSP